MRVPSWLPILLGVLTAVGPASTDMYLPAFPAIEASLHEPPGSAQLSLATWFAGLAVGQITQGTLSDRYGRRRPLIVSTALYTLSCAACALAPSILALSGFRFLSAVAAAAGMVIPRAVVRDLADGHAAAVLMSRLMLVMGAAPILAPTIGGAVLVFANWRWIFWILTLYGAGCFVLVCVALPDTLPPDRRSRLSAGEQIGRYVQILRDRGFLTHAALGGCGTFAFFAYLGGSSPVFIDGFSWTPSQYGGLFGACALGLVAAAQINARILPRFGPSAILRVAARADLIAMVALTALAFAGVHRLEAVIPPLLIFVSCQGFVNPNATVGALSRHAAHAGSASALMGMGQFLLGAISGLLVGLFTDGTARGMAALMLVGAAGMVVAEGLRPRPWSSGSIGTQWNMSLVVGIPACARTRNETLWHETPARYAAAVFGASGALPIMIAPMGEAQLAVLDRIDGLLLSGSPSNVHPTHYQGGDSLTPELHDMERDATTLPLIRAAVAQGLPVLAICRGIQELNVALGGTLHQIVHEIAGRRDHRSGPGTIDQKYGPKHKVILSGRLARLIGATEIVVNSLHGQAIDRPAPGLVVEARAEDGTIEAVWAESVPGFAVGVQWHPEWQYADDPASLALFRAFGDACLAYRSELRKAA